MAEKMSDVPARFTEDWIAKMDGRTEIARAVRERLVELLGDAVIVRLRLGETAADGVGVAVEIGVAHGSTLLAVVEGSRRDYAVTRQGRNLRRVA